MNLLLLDLLVELLLLRSHVLDLLPLRLWQNLLMLLHVLLAVKLLLELLHHLNVVGSLRGHVALLQDLHV